MAASTEPSLTNAMITCEHQANVAILSLNRPERRNALSDAMIAALHGTLADLADQTDVRAIILRATGPVFCAGHDLAEMTERRQDPDRGRAAFDDLFARCSALMIDIVRHPKPIIAEVQGPAFAAGCQLVASCDLAVASEHARFATPGVHIGLFCSTPMVALGRNVPRKRAMEMLLLGDAIDAHSAAQYGLVNRVVPADALQQTSLELAGRIASRSPGAIRHGKHCFHDQLEIPLADAYGSMGRVMAENMLAADSREGIDAFLGKRTPVWPEN